MVSRVAAIDIGTNTTRLMIADTHSRDTITPIVTEAVVTRLGQDVDATGALAVAAIDRTIAVLANYGDQIRSYGCEAARAIATSATRDASNRATFLDKATAVLGVTVEVIDGDEEALLAFRGTTASRSGGPFLVIDTGGGSTEFVFGTAEPEYSISVDIGSVRLTERSLAPGPVAPDLLKDARTMARSVISAVSLPGAPEQALGVAGTFATIAALHLELPVYDAEQVHGTMVGVEDITRLVERLATMTTSQIAAMPAMDPDRAPVILGGMLVAEQALLHTGADWITVSEQDNLDGIAMSLASGG